jgi:hypothetical protein
MEKIEKKERITIPAIKPDDIVECELELVSLPGFSSPPLLVLF